jgi:hemolysin activation/secretion protein
MRRADPKSRPTAEHCFPCLLRSLAAIILPLASAAALAQVVPDAGSALRDVAPQGPPRPPAAPAVSPLPSAPVAPAQPAAADQIAFTLRSVSFSGNTVFSSAELAAMAAEWIGRQVTFADLDRLCQQITERYREAGYPLAQAVLPVQDVTAGAVEISIVEGSLGRIRLNVAPEAPIDAQRIELFLAQLKTGKPIRQQELERTLMLISDLPGITVQSALEQGAEPGTTDLIVDVGAARRVDLVLDADNYGLYSTGQARIGATMRVNSPFRLGDNLDLRLIDSSANGLVFGRVGYELPVGGWGTRLGAAYGQLHYRLGKEFASLDSFGSAKVFELSVSQPLLRSRARNLVTRLGLQQKFLDDQIGSVGFNSEQRIDSEQRIALAVLGIAYEGRDGVLGGGYSSAGLSAYLGNLDLRSPDLLVIDQAPGGPNTDGGFVHLNYQLSRLQAITRRVSAYLGLAGQWANKNLTSAEKIALGGPTAVRAYPPSEGVVDEGAVLNGELRFSVNEQVTVSGFYDAGWGRYLADPLPGQGDNTRTLRGYGLGLYWSALYGFALRGSAAWQDSGPSLTAPNRVPRVYLQLTKSF